MRLRIGRLRARGAATRRVLLVGENDLMWQYLDDYRDLFAQDHRLLFSAAAAHTGKKAEEAERLARERDLPFLKRAASTRCWWDLVVFPNHYAAHRYPHPVSKLRIQHALSDGKQFDGRSFRYDPRLVLRPDGTPLYDMIFDASEERRQVVEQSLPALRGRIRVVGDLRADALLRLEAKRASIRAAWGHAADDRVVVLCSTWGAGSLIEQMGPALVEEARRLGATTNFRFVLSVHPDSWRDPRHRAWLHRVDAQQGVRVLPAGEAWPAAFVAADALVSDHTSLLAMYALLRKPFVCAPVPAAVLDPQSILGRLHARAPCLSAPGDLEATLRAALTEFDGLPLRAVAHAVDSHPGEAAERMRAATYELLSLQDPESS